MSGSLKLIPTTSAVITAEVVSSEDQIKTAIKDKSATLIERYNLEQLFWRTYWATTQDVKEIVKILNNTIEYKEGLLHQQNLLKPNQGFSRLTDHDVIAHLTKHYKHIGKMFDIRQRKLMEETVDIISNLQKQIIGASETLELWQQQVRDARGKDNFAEMTVATRVLAAERAQLVKFLDKLAALSGTVKTHISIDVMGENIQIISSIIENAEGLDEQMKIGLLSKIQQSVKLTLHQSVNEPDV